MNRLQQSGYDANKAGLSENDCPFAPVVGERHQRREWVLGWEKADAERPKPAPVITVRDAINEAFPDELFERMERSRDARKPYADDL